MNKALYSSEQARQRIVRLFWALSFLVECILKVYQSAMEKGLKMDEVHCIMCFGPYTKVMTFEEQLEAEISSAKFEEMNFGYDDSERRWRNIALPCGHAQVIMSHRISYVMTEVCDRFVVSVLSN